MSQNPRALSDSYQSLIIEYASGSLDGAYSLMISAHMTISPEVRMIVQKYESVGGSMLYSQCQPVEMSQDSLSRVMDKLDAIEQARAQKCAEVKAKLEKCALSSAIPSCLEKHTNGKNWHGCGKGMESVEVETACPNARAEIIRLKPGVKIRPFCASAYMGILVLEGALSDEETIYERGDAILTKDITHILVADAARGALCFAVRPKPTGIHAMLERMMARLIAR